MSKLLQSPKPPQTPAGSEKELYVIILSVLKQNQQTHKHHNKSSEIKETC